MFVQYIVILYPKSMANFEAIHWITHFNILFLLREFHVTIATEFLRNSSKLINWFYYLEYVFLSS